MSEELKTLTNEIQSTWEQMKAKNDEVLAETKKLGEARVEGKQALDRMGDRLDELELKLQRQALPGNQLPGVNDEKKSAHAKAFYKMVRLGKAALEPEERKALVEDTTGLYLVPEDLEAEIYRDLPAITVIRQLANIRPTTVDKVSRRALTEVSVGWGKLETGTDITETDVTPSKSTLYVEDLYGLAKIGEDELADVSDADLQSILADSFRRAIAETEEAAFAIGTGHSNNQPEGVAVDATIIASYKDNLATADTIVPDDVIGMEYELLPQYLQGASFLMHRKTEKALRLVRAEVASGYYGNYLWQPSLQAGMPNNFDGYPIYNCSSMNYPSDATAAVNVIFGNFKAGYTILDRKGMSIQRLNELYAEQGLIGFKAHFRVGGGVVRPKAFRALYNNT